MNKKIYYVECDSEYATDLTEQVNKLGHCGFFNTLKEAKEEMRLAKVEAKKEFAKELALESENENTITIDIWEAKVDKNFDEETDSIWENDTRQLIDSCFLIVNF